MKSFREYINDLNEGRTKTHGIKHVKKILPRWFSYYDLDIVLETNLSDDFQLYINNNKNFKKENLYLLINLCENLGYFPSIMFIDGLNVFKQYKNDKNSLKKDKSKKKNEIDFIDFIKQYNFDKIFNKIVIQFECWQDYDIPANDIPDILYHVTRKIDINKIKNIGLCPLSKSKISYHPERIYFSFSLKSANGFLNQLKNKNDYKVLKIEIDQDLKNILYLRKDPNYDDGWYTTTNIPKKYFENVL